MYNRQLDTFLKLAELDSFSKAAEALYITPSAVIQQINALEDSLHVSLFIRTHQGVTLTEAGQYLVRVGSALIVRCREIQEQLLQIAHKDQTEIRIGTTLLQKCRLFYPLWAQFGGAEKGYSVNIQSFDQYHDSCHDIDLVESLRDGELWQKGFSFLPLCNVPIVCAVPRSSPLADMCMLTTEALRGRTFVTIHTGMSEVLDRLNADLKQQGIEVREVPQYDLSTFALCAVNHYVLQTPACWQDIHPDLVTIRCRWDYCLPYGLFYRENAPAPAQESLPFVKGLQASGEFPLPDFAV